MYDLVVQLITDIVAILIPILVGYLVAWLQKRLGTEKLQQIKHELETKKELARIAVQFVQQAYKDLGGAEKYDKAAEWLAETTERIGLHLTPDEVKVLIEAALKELKAEFGKAWYEIDNP